MKRHGREAPEQISFRWNVFPGVLLREVESDSSVRRDVAEMLFRDTAGGQDVGIVMRGKG